MKKQRIAMLWSLLFFGVLALSTTQAAQSFEIKGNGYFPYDYCFTCVHPIWGYR
ncbi:MULTISPECIES: hypothetical protein [Yersinia]|uniref:hypothetical protein n=1 Tax=Yersinia TaxID=629 RepID=UPI0005DADEF1|nr:MULTISPECIES: hypothetical protein [Yersinia]MCB5301308.1 hypothetical protein [Yersinia bercovieri]MDN0101632.1 hypothetical protein [Yersinia bercovieri]QKJ07914.1 hypothetical protein HRK25_14070 [Yersinia bercovieri ATCC 43970]CFQ36486.1 Uncharacterised protein [Yersinia bercovieri]CNE51083.1 Uncharacterised protein [Yersinia bercovieri]